MTVITSYVWRNFRDTKILCGVFGYSSTYRHFLSLFVHAFHKTRTNASTYDQLQSCSAFYPPPRRSAGYQRSIQRGRVFSFGRIAKHLRIDHGPVHRGEPRDLYSLSSTWNVLYLRSSASPISDISRCTIMYRPSSSCWLRFRFVRRYVFLPA